MTSGAKKAAWVLGLFGVAAVSGTAVYFLTKPKLPVGGPIARPTPPPPGGGSTATPTFVTPTVTPGIYAAVTPNRNVSWVDQDGRPIGGGGGGGIDTSASRVPR